MKKFSKQVFLCLNNFLLIILVIFLGINLLSFLGYQPPVQLKTVLTGSMQPKYPQGSLLVISKIAPKEIVVGDVITFELGNDSVSHRVIEIVDIEPFQYRTKGDNNKIQDNKIITENELIGKVIWHIPIVGRWLLIMKTKMGQLFIILALIFIFLLDYLIGQKKQKKQHKLSKNSQL